MSRIIKEARQKMDDINVIEFSGGRTSAYMTKRLIDEGLKNYVVCFQNTGKEAPKTLDFINECDKRWNLNIVWLEYRYGNNFEVVDYESASRNGRPFDELLAWKNGYLPNKYWNFCTKELKINTSKRYFKSIGIKYWTIYTGIRYDEPDRWPEPKGLPNFIDREIPCKDWKITKPQIIEWWANQDFDLTVNPLLGNCDGCHLKGKGILEKINKLGEGHLDWWVEKEESNEKAATFKTGISYKKIIEISNAQPGLFDEDPTFSCYCNVD